MILIEAKNLGREYYNADMENKIKEWISKV